MTLAPEKPATRAGQPEGRAPRVPHQRSPRSPRPGVRRRHPLAAVRGLVRTPLPLVLGDAAAALLGLWAADHAQSRWTETPSLWERLPYIDPSFAPLLVPLAWVLLVSVTHGYEPQRAADPASSRRHALLLGPCLMVGVLAAAAVKGAEVDARELLVLAVVTSLTSVVVRWATRAVRGSTAPGRRVVVLGHRSEVEDLMGEFRRHRRGSPHVVGVVLHHIGKKAAFDVPTREGIDSVGDAVVEVGADTVVVLPCRHVARDRLRQLAWDLDDRGAEMLVGPGLFDVAPGRARVHGGPGVPLLHVRHAELAGWRRRLVKSAWERGLAALMLVAAAPLLLFLVLAVRLDSPGRAIFRQTRVGLDGGTFQLLKLRTMTHEAARDAEDLGEHNEGAGPLFKVRRDPRVTGLGRVLRRYSLDELPQLVNVLRGDMSLIGPRPPLPGEVAEYDDLVRRRLRVKPGLTGAWQVSGRSDLSWEESVRLDLDYVDNWSVWTDLAILARTPLAVLGHRGAY